jgi:flagellar biosynthesis activator protein FlaF
MALPKNTYQRTPEPGNPARTEAWALLEAARELYQARHASLDVLRGSLRRNWRLWTIFQANLLDPECRVPAETRANLLGLANFIDRQTAELLAKPDPAKIEVLVNINRQISEGLLDGQRADLARTPPPAMAAALARNV